jgi:nitroimidazol reductase NimA-like FMN-containing flavoprotein (pyridoxamine 5'-phosphate oxidase superfamily)
MSKDYRPDHSPLHTQRRAELALTDAETRTLLERLPVGHVATAWDDQPFINPTTFWYDPAQHVIVFHSNVAGRIRANGEHNPRVCFEASEHGRFLPSNVALEFSLQYASVVAFGRVRLLAEPDDKRRALYGLIGKYFPEMAAGREFRPITDQELKRTSVYSLAIESWSGKRNWPAQADQSDEWPALAQEWLA